MSVSRPIPALYTVYILRSTIRHASLYIGSTTDPPRRLKQHNGDIKGGAARTSRDKLRPWEMVGLVSGFPGAVAALKFEWALTNPHLSLHIPSESRITVSRQKKRSGRPRRPTHTMPSILANLHLLLRVPSFVRWPLRLHIFVPEVYAAWKQWCGTVDELLPDTLDVVTDFAPDAGGEVQDGAGSSSSNSSATLKPWGIHALPLDYTPLRDYVDKARDIFTFQREGDCVVCEKAMPPGQGLYAVCPNTACEAVGHLRCWSEEVLRGEGDAGRNGILMPKRGSCPKCGGPVVWGDMMKELTLRLRAPKEVDKLVKAKRRDEKVADKANKANKADKADKTDKTGKAAQATQETDKAGKADEAEKAEKVKTKKTRAKSPKTTSTKRTATKKNTAKTSASVLSEDARDVIVLE